MLAALLSLQLTKMLYHVQDFLLLNIFIFVVGLHTCLTYGVQMTTLEKGLPQLRQVVASFVVVFLLVGGVALIYSWPVLIIVSLSLYLLAKLLERLSFNGLVARGKIKEAYGVVLASLSIEIVSFSVIWWIAGANGNRFLLPSLIVMFALVWPFRRLMALPALSHVSTEMNPSHHLLFALHSFAILVTMMSDRLLFASTPLEMAAEKGDYLLLYSYCSALYALGVSLVEVRRPELIQLALRVPDFFTFLRESGFPRFVFTVSVIALVGYPVAFILLERMGRWIGLSPVVPLPLMLGGLIAFFAGFLLLAFQQIYYLAIRSFALLFASWGVAIAVRAAAYAQPGWAGFFLFSGLSGFAGMACLMLSSVKGKVR